MRRNKLKLVLLSRALLMSAYIGVQSPAIAYATPTAESVQEQENALAQLQAEVKSKSDALTTLNNQISENLDKQTKLQATIDSKTAELSETETKLAEKMAMYEENMRIAKGRLLALQQSGTSKLELYLNSVMSGKGFSDIVQNIAGITIIFDSQEDQINEIEEKRIEIEKAQAKLVKEKVSLEADQQEAIALSEKLNADKEVVSRDIDDLAQKQQALEDQLAADKQILTYSELAAMASADLLKTLNVSELDSETTKKAVETALSYIGTPYVWGGADPSGFDCSGLTQYAFAAAGVSLPRVTTDQENIGTDVAVSIDSLKAGDLVFWGAKGSSHHVGMYIGNGYYVHAPKPGDVVRITHLEQYKPDFAKRVVTTGNANATALDASIPITGTNLGTFVFTRYSAYDGGISGVTAGGTSMANGNIYTDEGYRIIAVDKNVISLGSIVRITTSTGESFLAQADDTGGAINGKKIDIAESSYMTAISKGNGTATIELIRK